MTTTRKDARRWERTSKSGIYHRDGLYRFRPPKSNRWEVRTTMAEAQRDKAAMAAGLKRPASEHTFAEYAERWLREYTGRTRHGLTDSTLESYRYGVGQAVERFGTTRLDRVNGPALKAYVAELSTRGLAPASIRRYLAPVKALLATAAEDGLIAAVPPVRIVAPDTRRTKPKHLTPAQADALLAEIPDEHRDLVGFLATTGARISEALGLRYRTIETVGGVPTVRFERSKTVAGLSPIALTPVTARMLTRRRAAQGAGPDDLVFPSASGTELDRRGWSRRVFKPAAERAGVPWATPHVLRHTVATRMIDAGETAERAARQLRHADGGRLAQATYAHPDLVDVSWLDG